MDKYGCSGKDRPTQKYTTYPGKSPCYDHSRGGTIVMNIQVNIPYVFTENCQYDRSDVDKKCSECIWRKKIL